MGNDVDCVSTFDFIDNSSNAGGLQWSSHGSAFANSDGFSDYLGISGANVAVFFGG
jgi:hypothetical protein